MNKAENLLIGIFVYGIFRFGLDDEKKVESDISKENIEPATEADRELKSFKLYHGPKAPLLIKIFAGLMWFGAGLMILEGVVGLVFFSFPPIQSFLVLGLGLYAAYAGKLMFDAKRKAIYFVSVFVGILLIAGFISLFSTGLSNISISDESIISILYGLLLVLIILKYRDSFVN